MQRVGNSLPKLRDNLSVEMSVRNYHHSLRNNPEEHSPYKRSSYYFVSSCVSSMNISSSAKECGFQEFIAPHSTLPSHKINLSIPVATTCSNRFNMQQDRQCTCKCEAESRSCKHCCSGKAVSITYSESVCVSVSLVIQHTMSTRIVVIRGLPGSAIFFHFLINGKIF